MIPSGAIQSRVNRLFVVTLALKYRYILSLVPTEVTAAGSRQAVASGGVVVILWSLKVAPKEAKTPNNTGAEVPPLPTIAMLTKPGVALRAALTVASNCVPFKTVVGNGVPIH